MGKIHRMGDANNVGGAIDDIPQTTVFADNKLVAINGSQGSGDENGHDYHKWATANGSKDVFVNGIPVNFEGNADTCGDNRVAGSSDVFVN